MTIEQTSSGYSDLLQEVRRHVLMAPRRRYYGVLAATTLLALAAVVAGLVLLRDSWWVIALAPPFAVVPTQIAFFSHDAAHRQITRKARPVAALCPVSGNLQNGLSYGWWLAKHNAHHAHPNDLETDPDVAADAFVWDADQARARTGFAAWTTRHQAVLFFPLLTLEAVQPQGLQRAGHAPAGLRYRTAEGVLLALLISTMTWAQALVFLAVHQGLFGVYLGCSFAPSHKGMPALTPEQSRTRCSGRS